MKTRLSATASTALASPVIDTRRIAHLHAVFANGYTPEDANKVCGEIRNVTGIEICVAWEVYDDVGFGGGSVFAIFHERKLFECASGLEELSAFLWGRGKCPSTITVILGAEIDSTDDSDCNFARSRG